jgi:tripartite ATP-independent transporter DctP family solute receptor
METAYSGRAMKFPPFNTWIGRLLVSGIALLLSACGGKDVTGDVITLKGATQFDESHVFTRTIRKFEELVVEYYGKPVNFELYLNSELGLEKDYFGYMSQGISVDYGIVSPSHMSTFSKAAPLMDMPFLFRDLDHWNHVLESDAMLPIADEISKKADVMLIGYAGGGTRNLIVSKPITSMSDLKGLNMRVMGAPIQTRIFRALGASPSVIAYSEVYNAIQTGVIDAAENEAAGIQQMKFYEVGPDISLTQHAITVRPLCFSGKIFCRLPGDLQAAIVKAGREAGAFGRQLESTEDAATLAQMEKEGKLRTHGFTQRDELLRLAEPVKAAYAKEIDSVELLGRINAVE